MRTEETSLYQEIQRSASRNGAVLTMGSARDAEKQPLKFYVTQSLRTTRGAIFRSIGRNAVNVLQEILTWSSNRPTWQRDALRRLLLNGELSDDDVSALAQICKGDHGLAEKAEVKPLGKEHVPGGQTRAAAVSLVSIFHHKGVNALAEDQTLKFSPGLTIIYGDNGAGKTGYIRILKQACRARGLEQIWEM